MKPVYTLIGGDARQRYLAQALAAAGFAVHWCGVPGLCDTDDSLSAAVREADAVVVPMPALQGELSVRGEAPVPLQSVLEAMPRSAVLLGGMLEPARAMLDASGIRWIDYAADEALQIENAALTAEAALSLAMRELPGTIADARALVIGFGRIGSRLCSLLKALGASVTASARRPEDFARIRAMQLRPEVTRVYQHGLRAYDLIVNTVPAYVLTEQQLLSCKEGCVYLELASRPGGLSSPPPAHIRAVDGRGLPGKYAPEAAARIVLRTLLRLGQGGER